ncbi:MAG: tetratricopeptide repeat protein [Muribaculaceae bacterium]|nr:tetratricopeptide repeat protein [Muribaculaceae bacterium]
MKARILTLLLMVVAFGWLTTEAAVTLAEADSAYNDKEYGKAIEIYNNIRQEEGSNAALLYNLGNSYYQEGDFGNAMICYLRAHRLDPSNKDINANLTFLRSKVDDANKAEQKGRRLRVTPDEEGFFQSVRRTVAMDTSTDTWAVWGAVFFILFVSGVALYIFTRNVFARKVGFFGSIVCLCGTVIFLCFAFMGARAYSARNEGVVTGFKVTLLTEPGKQVEGDKGNVLTKGTVVQILSEETDAEGNINWYKVRLNSDYIGWIEAENLAVI